MADGIKQFTEVTTPSDADAIYLQTSADADGYVTAANFGAYFGSSLYTVETATDSKSITSTAANYMLVFTRQATAKTITLPDAGNAGRTIKIVVTGSGVGNVTLANGDSATLGGFAVGDWEWSGTGNLTLIDDGTNWQVGESGIWDTYDVTYDSIDYPQDKFTNGKIVRHGSHEGSAMTQNDVYDIMSTVLTSVGDVCLCAGGINSAGAMFSKFFRSGASTITLVVSSGANIVCTDGSATLVTGSLIKWSWETKNTKWTS